MIIKDKISKPLGKDASKFSRRVNLNPTVLFGFITIKVNFI